MTSPTLDLPYPSLCVPLLTGASGDFQQVTRIARLMVTQLGFCKNLGQVAWSSGGGQSFLGGSMAQPSDFSMQVRGALVHIPEVHKNDMNLF